jgi:hypothetical protein
MKGAVMGISNGGKTTNKASPDMEKSVHREPAFRDKKTEFWINFFIGFLGWFIFHGLYWGFLGSFIGPMPDTIGLFLLCFGTLLLANVAAPILLFVKEQTWVAFGFLGAIAVNAMGIILVVQAKGLDPSDYDYIEMLVPFFLLLRQGSY